MVIARVTVRSYPWLCTYCSYQAESYSMAEVAASFRDHMITTHGRLHAPKYVLTSQYPYKSRFRFHLVFADTESYAEHLEDRYGYERLD